ncbi:MAG: flagellar hook-length control protein FliK [Bacillota bacterium]
MEKSVGFIKNNQKDNLLSTKKTNKKDFKSNDKKFENVFDDTKKKVKKDNETKNSTKVENDKVKNDKNVEESIKNNSEKNSNKDNNKVKEASKKKSNENEKVSKAKDKVESKTLEQKVEELKKILESLGIQLDESQIMKLAKNLNVKDFTNLSNLKKLTNEELVNHLKDFKGFLNQLKNNLESKDLDIQKLKAKFDDLLKKLDGKIKEIKLKDPKTVVKKDSVEKTLKKMVKEASKVVNKVKDKSLKKSNELSKDQNKNVEVDNKEKNVVETTKKDTEDNKNNENSKGKDANKEILAKVNQKNSEVKSANIKTNSNETKVDFQKDLDFYLKSKINQNKEIFSQVKNKISTQLNENASEMKLQLNPKSLGKVDMKISVEKNVVLAEIEVENAMVKQAIESNLNDLKNALSEKGYNLDQLDVSLGNEENNEDSSNGSFYESLFENDNLSENTDEIVELDQSQILNIMKKRQVAYLG